MLFETFKKILHKLRDEEVSRISLFWKGEPCLSPHLPKLAKYARSLGYWTSVSTNTAVHSLHDRKYISDLLSGLDKIQLCVDGWNQETLSKYRVGAKWGILLRNLEVIGSVSTRCRKDMRVLMFKYNEGHESKFRSLAKKHNIDTILWGLPIINAKRVIPQEEADKWLAENPKYQRYEKVKARWTHKTLESCKPSPGINVWGDMYPCCYDRRMEHPLGNILTDSLEEIKLKFEELKPQMKRRPWRVCNESCFFSKIGVNIEEGIL